MAWYTDLGDAQRILPRHQQIGVAHIYRTEIEPNAMLACLKRLDEGMEIIVDPELVDTVLKVGD